MNLTALLIIILVLALFGGYGWRGSYGPGYWGGGGLGLLLLVIMIVYFLR